MSFTDFHQLPSSVLQDVLASGDSDEITTAIFHSSIESSRLVLGTRCGHIWVLSRGEALPVQLGKQNGRILAVSIDGSGAFVASSADDGSVVVYPLRCKESEGNEALRHPRWICNYPRPVLSVAFNPKYASGVVGARTLCVGGEECKLIISRRGAFESKNVTVHHGEGPITQISWRGALIAWANSKGVKIVDVETYQKVTHLARPVLEDCAVGEGRCCLTWHGDDVLLIGWGSVVLVAEVKQKVGGPQGVRFATVSSCFRLISCVILGIAAFDSKHLAVLTADGRKSEKNHDTLAYHVCGRDGRVLSSDQLQISGSSCMSHFVSAADDHISYIINSREIIAVERRSISNHITWLIHEGEFEIATALALHSGSLHDAEQKKQICMLCITPLLSQGDAERAGRLVRQMDIWEADTWMQCINLFDQAGALQQLVPVIPSPPRGASLPCEVYDAVLNSLATVSPQALLAALEQWPAGTYSAAPLRANLHDMLQGGLAQGGVSNAEQRLLVEALASLHQAQGDLSSAADLLLQLGSNSLFPFLARHVEENVALRDRMCKKIPQLFDLSPAEALELFVQHWQAFPADVVIESMASCGHWWQYQYLRLLHQKQPTVAQPLRAMHLKLIGELEPHNLCSFLEQIDKQEVWEANHTEEDFDDQTDKDPLIEARQVENGLYSLDLARSCGAVDAEAMLLVRKGDILDGLTLCLHRLGDVWTGLRFVNMAPPSHMSQAWDDLVKFVSDDCQAYAALMDCLDSAEHLPAYRNATQATLAKRFPPGLEVPGLAFRVARAIKDAQDSRDVYAASLELLQSRSSSVSRKLFTTQRRGVAIAPVGWVQSEKPREVVPASEGAPWHKIRAPHFQLAMVLRAAVENL